MSTKKQRLPDFIIIGAEKAGTTWLGKRLDEQTGVFLSRPLEIHYFDHEENYRLGVDWYASHFANTGVDELAGEKTPGYLWAARPIAAGPQNIPQRMHDLLPSARLIVIFRDPVDRVISALNHQIRGRNLSPYVNADEIVAQAYDIDDDRYGLISQGLYALQLERYLKMYPREQIHVMFFEDDIVGAPQAALEGVMRFLGRSAGAPLKRRLWPENKRMHSRTALIMNYYVPALSRLISAVDRFMPEQPEIRPSDKCVARLREYFAPHNRALFDLVGRSTDTWSISPEQNPPMAEPATAKSVARDSTAPGVG